MKDSNQDIFLPMIQSLYTSDDVDLVMGEIDVLLESIYEKGMDVFENSLKESVRVRVARILRDLIADSGMSSEVFLKKLKEKMEILPIIKLTTAFEPTQGAIERIAKWIKLNISNYTIIEQIFDKNIVGGVVIEYQGNYHDYSLKRNFKTSIESKKAEILDMLGASSGGENE
jgi:F0F1-type ATP synthase delta subunit